MSNAIRFSHRYSVPTDRRREGPRWQSSPPPRRGYPAVTVVYFLTAASIHLCSEPSQVRRPFDPVMSRFVCVCDAKNHFLG